MRCRLRCRPSACFWGKCVEETALYGLLNIETTFARPLEPIQVKDPTCGAKELLYGNENPSPASLLTAKNAEHTRVHICAWLA